MYIPTSVAMRDDLKRIFPIKVPGNHVVIKIGITLDMPTVLFEDIYTDTFTRFAFLTRRQFKDGTQILLSFI
jgi:hypothetical protein